ncbi:sodium:proton antiporter NhaD [Methylocaldum gracile subsp. desertum]|uniref:sodium:proton antiporter NhaD n=1 Tax=Methylocaldum sp. GT1BW TaxID=3438964 RepID=UPI003DA05720
MNKKWLMIVLAALPVPALSAEGSLPPPLDLTHHAVGYLAVAIFLGAYALAMIEEVTELRKSKPMVLAASLIWVLIAAVYVRDGLGEQAEQAFRTGLEGYAELFLFILVSMTYLNAMEDRGVFESLRIWLLRKGFSYRQLFWITGCLSFLLSSVCNNLTTALLMGTVIMAMGRDNRRFIGVACVNVVVATNAGGSFSPFGDITTLLVWQKGGVPFIEFYSLLVPSIVNFVLPAAIMYFWVPKEKPAPALEAFALRRGAKTIILLFLLTIVTAVCFENFLSLPPAAGMLAGLTYLKFFSYYLQKTAAPRGNSGEVADTDAMEIPYDLEERHHFDVFHNVSRLEWDTLLFFYGVMVSVGGLSFIGYLNYASQFLYTDLDPTIANVLVGIISAFIDNGTIMFAVLTMMPDISQGQWLLVTLTAGVGGSLLAIGSAAGVGLLGQAKGFYTFSTHLKWVPAIALGYAGSIVAHFVINARYF